MKKKIAFVGARGLVGQTLLAYFQQDLELFSNFSWSFFSHDSKALTEILSSFNLEFNQNSFFCLSSDSEKLWEADIILTTQGSDFTNRYWPKAKEIQWNGIWLDAASALRLHPDSCLVLPPLNGDYLKFSLSEGKKLFIGANCTVSLLLIALKPLLIPANLIHWLSSMTYQAVSGAGAQGMQELLEEGPQHFPRPIKHNIIPWIDAPSCKEEGLTKEEEKSFEEANKILWPTQQETLLIDSLCVRVPVLRCHSQAITLCLKEDISVHDLEKKLKENNPWVKVIPNTQEETYKNLTPLDYQNTDFLGIGRIRKAINISKSSNNKNFPVYHLFTIGDQLRWGAARPLYEFLKILVPL